MQSDDAASPAGFELGLAYPDEKALDAAIDDLVSNRVASRVAGHDATLWGPDAEEEARKRLAWTDLHVTSVPLVAQVTSLRDELRSAGLDRVVLCGMGGSSLAPEVICATAGVPLTVLDSSDPDMVREAIDDDLERTVVVVSSKSGGTVETDSQRRAYEHAFEVAGIDPATRIVVVTDPGSPLDVEATEKGYRVFHADPDVGGRYSALTAFGLVPSGLAGADVGALLEQADEIAEDVAADDATNPALVLGALLGVANADGADKLVLADAGSTNVGFGDWVEQLVAESTGKQGKGILPVVVGPPDAPNADASTRDEVVGMIGPMSDDHPQAASGYGFAVDAPLGALFLLWEYATAIAGHLIGINPFDQPDVESAKQAAREMLEGSSEGPVAVFSDGGVTVYDYSGWLPDDTTTVREAVASLLDELDPERGYVAVQAYLDRTRETGLADARDVLASRTGRPTTFGWGPRFLHSTGQYHKGGPTTGVYLQVTGDPDQDLDVPGRPFTFGEFLIAQAVGDAGVLAGHGRPVLRLHLDRSEASRGTLREALE
ncbi:glucose-6-phosphate isomerase [Mumia sp. zg.B53]|uniref:glucose-6-phosphate isomerase n=1 Tax=unclassified Mumia TaxID=2621872 RepID=UPI001C6E0E6C|nr:MULTISPECIES: glucose-6-phosphate isomerase [unclassified Mumia]MBW9205229.1 glucose-6-phosphate isomerase [Mumia sp. zg.B17]MBW9208774.1 glucose-6-phosphate isomerase [Mumia sp. zg.B21]MBW9213385.1 glucose-6-phosphate isomerase [Mumia sp. zg.B53]MDD9348302.1 glucose-6-phosphate isomerase [Mumia sp.]